MSKSTPNEKSRATPAEPAAITEPPQFERALEELERLVDRLEGDELTLEESLAVFERGIGLTRACQQALDAAEQRVRILTEQSDTAEPEPFPARGDPSSDD
ncbi:MAG: exodeoxyribonuclease VII small subunit [Thiohalocapsa sp.]|uniref:exodeoxyribonuclease VII small subunit n=1 Tax=Thiohalocapsa sp. TaxID=2497641 RepID=UPI0025E7265E|nr:exodeoxyribonuclease VII small subunit [Thiohalocapsa sp.]MCG6939890.1 exodeoxyribonuclease VII small subunit [Thiohalocapsa sp.]